MLSFVRWFDKSHPVHYLDKLITKFIEISTDTFGKMHRERYINSSFLQDHCVNHTHILQHKLEESTNHEEKTMIGEMLKKVADLNVLLHRCDI
jgi:hypothetical protein